MNTDVVVRVPRFPAPGETLPGGPLVFLAGGKGANQAVAAARMGASVALVGAVGDDVFSDARRADLVAAGIDVSHLLRRSDMPGGVAVIEVDAAGQNAIVPVAGANGTVTQADVADGLGATLGSGDVLVCQFELPPEATGAALGAARRVGAYAVLNAAPFVPGALPLVDLPDALIVNEIEAGQILGRSAVTVVDAPAAAACLAARGPSVVVITLGERGAFFRDAESAVRLPAPAVTVVDTTGAGDAFVGAFAALRAEGQSALEAARAGVIAGSLAVERSGAQPSLPFRSEVEARLDDRR